MPGETKLDDRWVLDILSEISAKLSKLPEIELHLARQNASIEKTLAKAAALNLRVLQLERAAQIKTGRWQMVTGSALKLFEGVVLALMLWQLLGNT